MIKLKDKYIGKSVGEWLHYPIVLFLVLFLGDLIASKYGLGTIFKFILELVLFIIIDTIAEKMLIKK